MGRRMEKIKGKEMTNKFLILMTATYFICVPRIYAGGPSIGIYATEWTQILNNFELAASVAKQTTMVINQAKQIANQIEQLKSISVFSSGTWSEALTLLNKLRDVVHQGEAIAYSMSDIDKAFKTKYPGYVAPSDYSNDYKLWTDTTLDSIRGALMSVGLQSNSFSSENATITTLNSLSDSAVGQTQAIQVGNMIANETVSQLQKLREIQMSQIQAQSAYMAHEINKEAADEANLDVIFKEVAAVPGTETGF